jgi:REP element-mobilizing transposase RayT
VVHHVWARGIEGRAIFRDPCDRRDLVERFCEVFPGGGAGCLAWTFMSNHLHAVVRTGSASISGLMRRIHTGFALRFNLRYGRQGYLFQSRFGSRIVRDDGALLTVIRYVLRNPLEAGLVSDLDALERFPWSAYGALLGVRPALPFEAVEEALAAFGPDPPTARAALRRSMESAAAPPDGPTPSCAQPSLAGLIRDVCRELGVAESDLRTGRRSRPVSLARAEVCRRAVVQLGTRPVAVARALGISESAVSQALRRCQPRVSQEGGPSPS